jgi:lipid-A-disaccharide synthase-like uncharacterized protein
MQPQLLDSQLPITLIDLFKFIGSPVFIGALISFLLEGVAPFHALPTTTKRFVVLGTVIGLSVLSYALTTFVPASVVQALDPLYAAIAQIFIALMGTQVWHKLFKAVPPADTP